MMAILSAPSSPISKSLQVTVRRSDKGYPNRFKVWISGQVRRVTKAIRREMRRCAAIDPFIGHLKEGHRMGRNYLTGRDGDRINAVLAAAGYNTTSACSCVAGSRAFTRPLVDPLPRPLRRPASPNPVPQNFLHGRLHNITQRAGQTTFHGLTTP
jgi:hypothetical protein